MNNALVDMAGRAVLGNMWSTMIGGWAIFVTLGNVFIKIGHGISPAQIVADPDFLALGAGVVSIVKELDPKFMPQLFKA
ncbi:MAG: hypothetical protein ACR650_09870 [Methylocystis sp.]